MIAEQILRLQVAMQIVVLVHVGKALHRLEHNISNHLLWKKFAALPHQLINV